LAVLLCACSGGDEGPSCSLSGGTTLATSAWPKFRRDSANRAQIDVDLTASSAEQRWVFPAAEATSDLGAISTTPILGDDRIFVGASDGELHVLDFGGKRDQFFDITSLTALTSSALLGADGTIFVGFGTGVVSQYHADGELKNSASIGGFISGSLNIGPDGVTYIGTLAGLFAGVCPNGVPRFLLQIAPTQSSPAVASEDFCNAHFEKANDCPRILLGADDGRLRTFDLKGRVRWSFFASSSIQASPVLDESQDRFYLADTGGRVYAGRITDGERATEFDFRTPAAITASPALGREALYVADIGGVCSLTSAQSCSLDSDCSPSACATCAPNERCTGGTLYAVDPATGAVRWSFETGASVRSSPAVATGGDNDVVVFGSDDGVVHALVDEGTEPSVLWTFTADSAIGRSSPSIDFDGNVYIGTEGGRIYSIGTSLSAE
jgi:outer membrane protein assembly factor BamB